jgi:PAS domain S-box-containing protein
VSDPTLPDNPFVFASRQFFELTGYDTNEVLGRNCRFLQGHGTDARAVTYLRRAIAAGDDAAVCLLNYKKDGTPFYNSFFLAPLREQATGRIGDQRRSV